jgi:hypothetical protein
LKQKTKTILVRIRVLMVPIIVQTAVEIIKSVQVKIHLLPLL